MKKIKFFVLLCLVCNLEMVHAQVLQFNKAEVSFLLEAPAGSLTAKNKSLTGSIDITGNTFRVKVNVAAFRFDSETLPERINDYTSQRFHMYYMQSEKFPEAGYTGLINGKSISWTKDGTYKATTNGTLTIHGVSQPAEIPITVTIKNGRYSVDAEFIVATKDFGIRLPASVKALFFQNVAVRVKSDLIKM